MGRAICSTNSVEKIVDSGIKANLLIAFNVLPHVPNLNDFILAMKKIIDKRGIIIVQFSAYLLDVIQKCEFDMVYHEHFSYFSLFTLKKIFESNNLEIFDVQEISVHGGSLRLFLKSADNKKIKIENSVKNQLRKEEEFGITKIETYLKFQDKVDKVKEKIQDFFINAKKKREKNSLLWCSSKRKYSIKFLPNFKR